RLAIEFARSYGGQKIASVVASQILCGPIEAAFANGELAHSDETDDDFTTGGAHPGCAVVPAALALGEQFGISGTHFLRAVALGVHQGWSGVNDILSGPNNFVESYNPKADPAGMIDQLGVVYGVMLTTLKKWTTGGPIQAPLDALENLQKRQPFQADQVEKVVVRTATSAAYTVNNRDMP